MKTSEGDCCGCTSIPENAFRVSGRDSHPKPPYSQLIGNRLGTQSHSKATPKPPSCDLHATSMPSARTTVLQNTGSLLAEFAGSEAWCAPAHRRRRVRSKERRVG